MQWNVKTRFIILGVVMLAAIIFLVPTAKIAYKSFNGEEIYPEDKEGWVTKPISLGLDLSGGVQLTYRVEVEEAVKSRLQVEATNLKTKLLAENISVRKAVANNNKGIEITLVNPARAEKAKDIILQESRMITFDKIDEANNASLIFNIKENEERSIRQESVVQAVENLRSRVDQFGVSEPLIQRIGIDRIMLQMPGVKDIDSVKKMVGRVAKLEFRFVPDRPGAMESETTTMKTRDGDPVVVEDEVQMDGSMVKKASIDFDEYGNYAVALEMNPQGTKIFSKISGEGIGRQLAIILDGVVFSSPVIQSRIPNGHASITGNFSAQEAKDLAVVLKAGALPAPLTILQETVVGATLGQEAINSGVVAILVGFALILIFMVFYYKKSGVIASMILGLNVILVCALLSMFGATLTLPGLAGLALTIGMAVDANVIIFERIRDEIRNGSSRDNAVALGFERALTAIIDSNLTTLVTAVLLYYFGTGPVRGFAVTLGIGVVTTLFCGTFASRIFFDYFKLKSGKSVLSI